jgi:hypothetical protein
MIGRVSAGRVRRCFRHLDRVALRHDEFIIERNGRPLAALVPFERLEHMRRFARRHALNVMEEQKNGTLSDDSAMQLGLEAQRWARRRGSDRALKGDDAMNNRQGGRKCTARLSASAKRRIAALGGKARAESFAIARRIEQNLRYAAAMDELQPESVVVVREQRPERRLPDIHVDEIAPITTRKPTIR